MDELLIESAATNGHGPSHDLPALEAETQTPLLDVWGIVKRWPRRPDPVLDGLALEIPAGSAISIHGRNGVGKTTLLRVIAGLLVPDGGHVLLNGCEPRRDRLTYQRQLAFLVAGDRGMYARLTVRQQLAFWASLTGLARGERKPAINQAIADFALEDLAKRRVDRLSMGQRQRVRLAGTFLHAPKLVLLDEPRNSLDEEGIAMLLDVLRKLVAAQGSVVWCSPAGETSGLEFDASYILADGKVWRQ